MLYQTREMAHGRRASRPVKILPASKHLPVVKAAPLSDAQLIASLHERTLRLLREGDVLGSIAASQAMQKTEARSNPFKLVGHR